MNKGAFLQAHNITKDFPGVRALNGINFQVSRGEILGLVGENGAGKSTLMRILGGVYPFGSYGGDISVNDKKIKFQNPLDAEKAGIAIIHQELSTFSHLTVAENIFVGHWPMKNLPMKNMIVDWDKMNREAREWLDFVGAPCSPLAKMGTLSVGTQQLIEIAKALSRNSQVLILDEPTSALSHKESENLFKIMLKFKAEYKGLIYISHKMDEVFRLCDRLVVLRDGTSVFATPTRNTTESELIGHMVGRPVTTQFPKRNPKEQKENSHKCLDIRSLTVKNHHGKKVVNDLSLELREGEIFGLAGLLGSGRSETLHALFGDPKLEVTGKVLAFEKFDKPTSPKDSLKKSIALVCEDRKRHSIFTKRSLDENLAQSRLSLKPRFSIINSKNEVKINNASLKGFRVKTTSADRNIETLSGGNQQKVVLGRALQVAPKIILLDEPTRGVDVGAKFEIYEILFNLADTGHTLLVVSSELPELMGICDRIGVMNQGSLMNIFERQEFDPRAIMASAIGTP